MSAALSAAIEEDLGPSFDISGATALEITFLINGGGVERFLAPGLSKLAANAVKAGDLPLTRSRSGLNETLLERVCSGKPDLEMGVFLLGF